MGATHVSHGRTGIYAEGLSGAGLGSSMDVYVERDLPRRKIPGFMRAAGLRKRRKVFPQPPGVDRMRSTGCQGWQPRACAKQDSAAQWFYGDPENKCALRTLETSSRAAPSSEPPRGV
jgi:hypothetical protein